MSWASQEFKMEEKNDIGLKHVWHEHLLTLNENYIAREGEVCSGCDEEIDSCKSSSIYCCSNFTSTTNTSRGAKYSCGKFLLHKACAELPGNIVNPIDQNEFLFLNAIQNSFICQICGLQFDHWFYHGRLGTHFYVCFKCALDHVQESKKDTTLVHPGHSHPLALIQEPSSFKCRACKVNDKKLDSSYRCTRCQFWMHRSCAEAPHSFQFQFHKHPLFLLFFLPKVYRKFHQFCRICSKRLYWNEWLYCCRSCRYFTHFHCARSRSSSMLSSSEDETYPNLVHLPAADEVSLNLLFEQFIKDKFTFSDSHNNNSIFGTTNYIKHWSHEEHDLKLITTSELPDPKNDDEILLLCDGCVKPIRTCDSLFYACIPCKYFMHKVCAEFSRVDEHQLRPGQKLFANKYREPCDLFLCSNCARNGNGIFFSNKTRVTAYDTHLHIGCVTLPKVIKHEAHHHQLQLDKDGNDYSFHVCNACGNTSYGYKQHMCKDCKFYICGRCIMKTKIYKHKWDPHPLDLKYDAGMVEEHEHEFDCEFCPLEINTNHWFYHCDECDLSFHPHCIEYTSYSGYKDVNFRGTNIKRDELHPHGLTFLLNKKVRLCKECGRECLGVPVLQCAQCNVIFCCGCLFKMTKLTYCGN